MSRRRRNKFKENLVIDLFVVIIMVIKLPLELLCIVLKSFIEGWKERDKELKYLKAHQIAEEEAERLAQSLKDNYEKSVSKLRTLVGYTENKLYYEVVKTEYPSQGRIREYVNFFTYDRQTVAIENANQLINNVMNNVLGIYTGRIKKLQNTIVLDDYACDLRDLSSNLAQKLNVEEITMLRA